MFVCLNIVASVRLAGPRVDCIFASVFLDCIFASEHTFNFVLFYANNNKRRHFTAAKMPRPLCTYITHRNQSRMHTIGKYFFFIYLDLQKLEREARICRRLKHSNIGIFH